MNWKEYEELEMQMKESCAKYYKNKQNIPLQDQEGKYKNALTALRDKCIKLIRLYVYDSAVSNLLIKADEEGNKFAGTLIKEILMSEDVEQKIKNALENFKESFDEIVEFLNNLVISKWQHYMALNPVTEERVSVLNMDKALKQLSEREVK